MRLCMLLSVQWELKKFRNFYQKVGLIQDLLCILKLKNHFPLASILFTQDGFFITRIFSRASKQSPVSLLSQLCRHVQTHPRTKKKNNLALSGFPAVQIYKHIACHRPMDSLIKRWVQKVKYMKAFKKRWVIWSSKWETIQFSIHLVWLRIMTNKKQTNMELVSIHSATQILW